MATVTKVQIQKARCVDLFSFLSTHHADSHKLEGGRLRPNFNHSINIAHHYSGYFDFATGEHGNSVDYLTRYLGYSFTEAIEALLNNSPVSVSSFSFPSKEKRELLIPSASPSCKKIFNYLTSVRSLSGQTINYLIKNRLLFQDQHGNCIFLNAERDWGERRGTGIKPFHGILSGSSPNGYWSFSPIPGPSIFICEAAIDAISLYELKKYPGIYVSIGGCGKQAAIDCLKKRYGSKRITIATDADTAGDMARQRNPDCKSLRPNIGKDWNEMIISLASHHKYEDSIK